MDDELIQMLVHKAHTNVEEVKVLAWGHISGYDQETHSVWLLLPNYRYEDGTIAEVGPLRLGSPMSGNTYGFQYSPMASATPDELHKGEQALIMIVDRETGPAAVACMFYNNFAPPPATTLEDDDGLGEGELLVRFNSGSTMRFRPNGDVEVSANRHLSITAGGDVSLTAEGNVTAQVAGDVNVTSTEGNVNVTAELGSINVTADAEEVNIIANGHINLISDEDDINLTANGDINIEAHLGDVSVTVENGNLDASVAFGDISVSAAEGDISLTSDKGDITMSAPQGKIELDADHITLNATGSDSIDILAPAGAVGVVAQNFDVFAALNASLTAANVSITGLSTDVEDGDPPAVSIFGPTVEIEGTNSTDVDSSPALKLVGPNISVLGTSFDAGLSAVPGVYIEAPVVKIKGTHTDVTNTTLPSLILEGHSAEFTALHEEIENLEHKIPLLMRGAAIEANGTHTSSAPGAMPAINVRNGDDGSAIKFAPVGNSNEGAVLKGHIVRLQGEMAALESRINYLGKNSGVSGNPALESYTQLDGDHMSIGTLPGVIGSATQELIVNAVAIKMASLSQLAMVGPGDVLINTTVDGLGAPVGSPGDINIVGKDMTIQGPAVNSSLYIGAHEVTMQGTSTGVVTVNGAVVDITGGLLTRQSTGGISDTAATYIHSYANGGTLDLKGQDVLVTSSSNPGHWIAMSSPKIELESDNLEIGDGSFQKLVNESFLATFNAHTHSGVVAGGGNSGAVSSGTMSSSHLTADTKAA